MSFEDNNLQSKLGHGSKPELGPNQVPDKGRFSDSGQWNDAKAAAVATAAPDAPVDTSRCLAVEVNKYGGTSQTPTDCPVEGCKAYFDSDRLRVLGKAGCQVDYISAASGLFVRTQ